MKWFNDFWPPYMFLPEQSRPPNILFYERSSLHPPRSVIVSIWSSFTKKSQGTKYGDHIVHFFSCYTLYNFYTPCIFTFILAYMKSMEHKLSNDIYFMGVKCTHYKLCSVQLKLVYFSQYWCMKHFLGPVCDIWPVDIMGYIMTHFHM